MAATSPFGKAFAAARKAGKKTFTHNGKLYTTKLKGEDSKSSSTGTVPKKVPVPESRPVQTAERTKDDAVEKKAAEPVKAEAKRPAMDGIQGKYDRPKSTEKKADAEPEKKKRFSLGLVKKERRLPTLGLFDK